MPGVHGGADPFEDVGTRVRREVVPEPAAPEPAPPEAPKTALQEEKQNMSLGKIRALKERGQQFHSKLTTDIDALMARYDELEKRKDAALGKHHAYLDSAQRDLIENEQAVSELSNLPLDGTNSGGG